MGYELLLGGCFHPPWQFILFPNCFPQPKIVYIDVYPIELWSVLNWEWKWGLTSLIKLVCEGTSQTDLGGWFSSLYNWDSTREGRHNPRDCGVEKGMIPGVGCADALEAMLYLLQVSISLGLSSLA